MVKRQWVSRSNRILIFIMDCSGSGSITYKNITGRDMDQIQTYLVLFPTVVYLHVNQLHCLYLLSSKVA